MKTFTGIKVEVAKKENKYKKEKTDNKEDI